MSETKIAGALMLICGAALMISFPIGKDVPAGNFAFVVLGMAMFAFPFIWLLAEILKALKGLKEFPEAKQKE